MIQADPALFRRFPAARAGLAHQPFLGGSTPVEPLDLPGLGAGACFVKRDERSCPLYGGNKPRKLEFVIGHALAKRSRRLVTTGGLGTNHGLATTILGRAAGLPTTLVLLRQPVTPEVQSRLLAFQAWGARLVWGANVPGTAIQVVRVLTQSWLAGERPCLVPTGGSSPRGNLGFVSAALELAEQVRAGALPEPGSVFVPVGTGGTLVGLVVGLRLAGLGSRATGVLVTDILPPGPRRLARAANATLALLRRADPTVPALRFAPDDFEVDDSQLGPGYGSPTAAGDAALAAADPLGLHLDRTYTGKCLAAILARARERALGSRPVLFWNTYNDVDVLARAPASPDPRKLPRAFRRFIPGRDAALDPGEALG